MNGRKVRRHFRGWWEGLGYDLEVTDDKFGRQPHLVQSVEVRGSLRFAAALAERTGRNEEAGG